MTNRPERLIRTGLPIPHRPAPGIKKYDAKDPETVFLAVEPLLPPGVPKVLISDVAFGASRALGGPCNTPTVSERLAAGGLSYDRLDSTAKIAWSQSDLRKDDHDRFIDPAERPPVAMARR